MENNEVIINDQFIGKISGLKLELDLKKGALETDIKSLKKAARQTVGPELEKRIQIIIETGLIELNNLLYNIVRVNTRDPTKKYIPDPDKKIDYLDLKDGFFHEESTLLTNPPSELRGVAKNRFYNLFKDPQKTAIEPVKIGRIGEDTYSSILDDYKSCPFNKSMYDNF